MGEIVSLAAAIAQREAEQAAKELARAEGAA
jgi:hypothetical protein